MDAARSSRDSRPVMPRGDRVALWLTAGVAGALAVAALASGALSTLQALREDPLTIQGFPLVNARTPEFTEPLAQVSDARYESAALTLSEVPDSARWFFAAQTAVMTVAVVGVSLALLWLCLRVLRTQPFGRSVTVALVTSAVLIVISGLASQLLEAAGRAAVVDRLGSGASGGADLARPEGFEGLLGFGLELDLAPIGVGVALAVIALAFQIGARMQRDTEGLV